MVNILLQQTNPVLLLNISIFELLIKGGVVMIPIGVLSLFGVYIICERFLTIRQSTKFDQRFLANILGLLRQKDFKAAAIFTKNDNTAISRIMEAGITSNGEPLKDIESRMETVANIETAMLEKNMSYLGIIAGAAPMLGFIGTIAGIIKIFYNISLADNISIGIIAGGLYEKMITSGSGLMVGIMAYIGFHLLHMMIDRFVLNAQKSSFELIKVIQETRQ